MRPIADVGNGLQNARQRDLPIIPAHAGAPGRIVDFDGQHTGQPSHMLFIQPDAGGTGDAFEHQRRFLLMLAQGAHEALLKLGLIIERKGIENIRPGFTR